MKKKNQERKTENIFRYCAGVGKTYTMLQTALSEKYKGSDIILGYVETHNRKETDALAQGLSQSPEKITNINPPHCRKWIWMQ
jgi:two-component system sensor histidine kinase KdpD